MNKIVSKRGLRYRVAMVISAEEPGWILVVGIAVAFAAELALSIYIFGGRANRPLNGE
jgi:hypothetical protein